MLLETQTYCPSQVFHRKRGEETLETEKHEYIDGGLDLRHTQGL
jgi:hypothetical protein